MRALVKLGLVACASGALATGVYAKSNEGSKASSDLPDLHPGDGWQERSPFPPEGGQARAWSDPAAGCHLSMFTLPTSESAGEGPLRASLEKVLAQSDFVFSQDESGFLRVTGVDLDGLASLSIIDEPTRSASLVACYWNEREPTRCQALCLRALQNRNEATE